jgi:NAD(P)-dependent dehydrogenase (short-subunit alcohol dehydrogenase family)
VLINNAGISNSDDWEKEPLDIMRRLYEVNALAPVEVTRRLLPHLAPAAKIVMITSRLASIAGTTADIPDVGYRMSKAALNIAGKLMAESLKPRGITVLLIHPGYVRTEMNDGRGDIDAKASARGVLALIERTGIEKTGTYCHVEGRELPW